MRMNRYHPAVIRFLAMLAATGGLTVSAHAAAPAVPAADSATHIPLIAVNGLDARGVTADEVATLTDVLRTELLNTGKYKVMERTQMEAILKEQGFQSSGACSDQQCMVEMGQLLGAEQLVAGSIGKVGKAYSINVRIISIRTGEILNNVSHSYSGPIEDLLTTEMKTVAQQLASVQSKPGAQAGNKGAEKSTAARKRSPMPVIMTTVGAGVVVIGGAAAFLMLSKKSAASSEPVRETTGMLLTW
jgi:curli biogenesis system outer membrane secretion channel CsgG